ncbi:MAG: hypothetical protein ACJ761_00315 [Chloroflexota bacterium]
MTRRLFAALAAAALFASISASAVFAGEVTGNGTLLHFDGKWETGLHGRSACAYSGQEDNQFFTDDSDAVRLDPPHKGLPGHSQSWGQIPHTVRAGMPAELHPGISCNPNKTTFFEP